MLCDGRSEMMHMPVREAVDVDEVDWALPRPEHWNATTLLGATRAAFFSGVKCTLPFRYMSLACLRVYLLICSMPCSLDQVNGSRGLLVATQLIAGCHNHCPLGNLFHKTEGLVVIKLLL